MKIAIDKVPVKRKSGDVEYFLVDYKIPWGIWNMIVKERSFATYDEAMEFIKECR